MGFGGSGSKRSVEARGRDFCQTWSVRLASLSASNRLMAQSCDRGGLRGAPAPVSALRSGKAGGTEVGDDTWAPLGSGFRRVMACWRAGAWGPVAVAASEAGRRAGMSSALAGLLGWPRDLGRPTATRASWAGWLLLCASGPSRPSQLWAFFFSFPFSILFFFPFV